eukprot:2420053-Rhodomonas_salina.1
MIRSSLSESKSWGTIRYVSTGHRIARAWPDRSIRNVSTAHRVARASADSRICYVSTRRRIARTITPRAVPRITRQMPPYTL